jgi:hypothetical protein
MFSQTTLVLALAASASAHMIMDFPKPFARSSLTSSPLKPMEFPCKQRPGAYNIDLGMNQWNAGETKEIVMNGTAAHAGGSCQYSITTDPEPNQNSQWKVIHSVVGNCLASILDNYHDVEQDKPPGIALEQQPAFKHPVTMPKDIPDGRYTFAWTWLNKKGNREFYMNCAPIQVGDGSSTAPPASAADALAGLPDMFVANLPGMESDHAGPICAVAAEQDFVYPNPGLSVIKGSSVNVTFGSVFGGAGCAKQNLMGAGAGKIGSPAPGTPSTPSQGTPSSPSKPSSAPSQSAVNPAPVVSQKPAAPVKGEPQPSKIPTNPNGGILAPGASSAPASAATPEPSPPAAKPTPPAEKPVPSTTPQTGGDNNTPQTGSDNTTKPANGECTPCTNDGAVVCIGSKQFGLCNRGCAVAQDLAAGMACSGGAIVGAAKRHIFPRSHLHRRFSASHML